MTFHITANFSPINAHEYASMEDAIAAFCTPDYVGAPAKTISASAEGRFTFRGDHYQIVAGRNPKALKAEAAARKPAASPQRRVTTSNLAYQMYNRNGALYG
jgi:hypothetical protein